MRTFLVFLLTSVIALSLVVTDAEARRFGSGKSFGMSRSINSTQRGNPSSFAAAPAQSTASKASRWLGPLAGLAMGGLLASLFMGHGLGSGLLSWLMIAGVIFFVWRLFSGFQMRNNTARMQPQTYQQAPAVNTPFNQVTPFNSQSNYSSTHLSQFDEADFLRQAKTIFIRLQAAYDTKNLADIREFTAPQVFAEVQMQLQERNDEPNVTEVIHIDATLADHTIESDSMITSVLFTGQIREAANAPAEPIKEMWHFKQDKLSKQWLVFGIEQVSSV